LSILECLYICNAVTKRPLLLTFKYLNMQSKLKFDIDSFNEAIIRFETSNDNEDLRDRVASRFFDKLGGWSSFCRVTFYPQSPRAGEITPVTPDELIALHNQLGELIKSMGAECATKSIGTT